MRNNFRFSAPAALTPAILLLAAGWGCTVGPDYTPALAPASPQFSALSEAQGATLSTAPTAQPVDPKALARWWETFNDPALNELIGTALEGNINLKVALARVAESRALAGAARSDKWPTVDAIGSAVRSRRSESTPTGNFGGKDVDDLYRAGFDASWELDLWGRVRRGVEAADAELAASEEAVLDVKVVLLAEVATTYAELRAGQQRLAVAQRAVKAREDSLRIAEARAQAGLTGEYDVAQARAELASQRSSIPAFQTQIRQSAHQLGVLVGQEPGALVALLTAEGPIPAPPRDIALGLPSELVQRRPDLRRAERLVAAATARVGVATADLFPKFTLSGSFVMEAANPADLADLNSRSWSIGPGVQWNVFDAGRVRRNIDAADARTQQSLLQYQQSVLLALREAENSIVALVKEQARWAELQQAVVSDERAVQLADALYKPGLKDLSDVLDNQRRLYAAQDALVLSQLTVTTSAISLYKALGGGWEPPASTEAPQATAEAARGSN